MTGAQQAVDKLYKERYGKLVGALLYSSPAIDPDTAEDIVQDSFSAALVHWSQNGLPLNPVGWIYKVCRNKALNILRDQKRVGELSEANLVESVESRFSESVLDDRQL